MKKLIQSSAVLCLFLVFTHTRCLWAEERIWTSSDGKFTVSASLTDPVSASGEIITLKKSDDSTIDVQINKLSKVDQEFITRLRQSSKVQSVHQTPISNTDEESQTQIGIQVIPLSEWRASGIPGIIGLNKAVRGVFICGLDAGGPAEKAGIPNWSIILSLNGKRVHSIQDLDAALKAVRANEAYSVRVLAPYPSGNYPNIYDEGVKPPSSFPRGWRAAPEYQLVPANSVPRAGKQSNPEDSLKSGDVDDITVEAFLFRGKYFWGMSKTQALMHFQPAKVDSTLNGFTTLYSKDSIADISWTVSFSFHNDNLYAIGFHRNTFKNTVYPAESPRDGELADYQKIQSLLEKKYGIGFHKRVQEVGKQDAIWRIGDTTLQHDYLVWGETVSEYGVNEAGMFHSIGYESIKLAPLARQEADKARGNKAKQSNADALDDL